MSSKKDVLSKKNPTDIIYSRGLTKYYISPNHAHFLQTITSSVNKNFYEHITEPINMFFDIEVYPGCDYFHSPESLITILKNNIGESLEFQPYEIKYVILESHSDSKRSYHVILRITNKNTSLPCMLSNLCDCKVVYDSLKLYEYHAITHDDKEYYIFDPSVYRDGLFRTIYSSKPNEIRPFVLSELSDAIESELDTFVCYSPSAEFEMVKFHTGCSQCNSNYIGQPIESDSSQIVSSEVLLTEDDHKQIIKYIRKNYGHKPKDIREIFIDNHYNCIVIALDEKYCEFIEREHKSNHQYIVIDIHSSKQKCHDKQCAENKHNEIRLQNYPKKILEIVKKCLIVNNHEMELVDNAIKECKDYIKENFNENVEELSFDPESQVFRGNVSDSNLLGMVRGLGKCPVCKVEHVFSNNGYCAKCVSCHAVFPAVERIPIADRYKNLSKFWFNYNQIINHGTVNNNVNLTINNFNQEEDVNLEVTLDESIFSSNELTRLMNECLDGHKVTKIGEILYFLQKDFIYSNGEWYTFTGYVWKLDKEGLSMRKQIMGISSVFLKIQKYYESTKTDEQSITLVKNVKSMINKLHKPGFEEEVLRGAKLFYNDEEFIGKLNSKKHLLPFKNGVYDLLQAKFRSTKKDDYINLTCGYDFDQNANNPEVFYFLEKILPIKSVRDYVLRKLAECLNGDIPNTNFLMFIGDGANGKSQLLNLMKYTLGDFGEKVEVTLLTRKRNNANETNTEKMKLFNKRFAFLSEPEDGEKINIGLLKELTGSEEIVARGLYQDSKSFVMEAKLFLACNELPEIKGEDKALWRRIRVIAFISRFVETPKEPNEFKIDITLPSKIREDISWRQTLINILLQYYHSDAVPEPDEVRLTTNQYREDNDFNMEFVSTYLIKSEKSSLKWSELWDVYQTWYREIYGNVCSSKKDVKKYFESFVFKKKDMSLRSLGGSRGWSGWELNTDVFCEDDQLM